MILGGPNGRGNCNCMWPSWSIRGAREQRRQTTLSPKTTLCFIRLPAHGTFHYQFNFTLLCFKEHTKKGWKSLVLTTLILKKNYWSFFFIEAVPVNQTLILKSIQLNSTSSGCHFVLSFNSCLFVFLIFFDIFSFRVDRVVTCARLGHDSII